MITDAIYLLLNAAQKKASQWTKSTGWQVFVAGWHLCHPVAVLQDALSVYKCMHSVGHHTSVILLNCANNIQLIELTVTVQW